MGGVSVCIRMCGITILMGGAGSFLTGGSDIPGRRRQARLPTGAGESASGLGR